MNQGDDDRRRAVVESALGTFSRLGYRKTSMDDVARAARISRPGLYFLFESKPALFREAVIQALQADLDAAETELGAPVRPLQLRLVAAFDRWAGRYVGPLRDVSEVIEANPHLLGDAPGRARTRFHTLLRNALLREAQRRDDSVRVTDRDPAAVATVLMDVSAGVKLRARTPRIYRREMAAAINLLLE